MYMAESYGRCSSDRCQQSLSPEIVTLGMPGYADCVTVSGTHAYVVNRDSGFQVIDITNPESPLIVGGVNTLAGARSVAVTASYAYVADDVSGLQILPVQCTGPQLTLGVLQNPYLTQHIDLCLAALLDTAGSADRRPEDPDSSRRTR
jgi:hypothetical protein